MTRLLCRRDKNGPESELMIALPDTDKNMASKGKSQQQADDLAMLIRECMNHSRSAQKKLYEQFAPAAYGIIKRYLFSHEEAAQEILNDAFFKILTKLDQYSFQGSFEGWVRRIVVNTVTDYLRKNVKDVPPVKEVQEHDAHTNSGSVEVMTQKEMLQVIQTLPAVHLAVFNLFVFEQYPHKEIAALLGISENNSRWYLNNARRRLKEKINAFIK